MKSLDQIELRPRDRAAILEAAAVMRRMLDVDRILLFCSKSRGDDDEESDIDLLVLTRTPITREQKNEVTHALYPLQLDHEVMLSPLVVPLDEWRSGFISVQPIHAEVEEQGVLA